jgi:uncharacterized protein YyaL (SSP411 family)
MNNPVAWQMWGEDAIGLARKHNKLIFVSIGYAACHCMYWRANRFIPLVNCILWTLTLCFRRAGCHVMERESFENEEVARLLNSHFIPIKIDREERPDVDRIYMNYVQATTGSGGWPLNVFITPGLEPVFGGTYWPGPNSNTPGISDQVSFLDILKKVGEVWRDQEERCLKSAKDILQQLKEFTDEGNQSQAGEEGDILEIDLLEEAYQHFAGRYDKANGGFSGKICHAG